MTRKTKAQKEKILLPPFSFSYTPVPVEHADSSISSPQGLFLLHHGLQRRLAMTIVLDTGTSPSVGGSSALASQLSENPLFRDVREVMVGRVRSTPEFVDSDANTRVLSLSVVNVVTTPSPSEDR